MLYRPAHTCAGLVKKSKHSDPTITTKNAAGILILQVRNGVKDDTTEF